MNFKGKAVKMQAEEIPAIASELGVEPAALRAVLTVETGGSGFDAPFLAYRKNKRATSLEKQPFSLIAER